MATLPINAMTSYAALFGPQYFGFPAPGSRVAERFAYEDIKLVILGARSVVGKFGIQFAKLVGIGTIIVTASLTPDSEKELKELGATKVIDRHSKTVIEDIWDAAGGKGEVGYVYDCVNWTYELAAELVSNKEGNKIMVLHRANSAVSELEKRGKGGVEAKVVVGGDREGLRGVLEVFWERIGECIVEGKVQIPRFRIIEGLDEERVNEALDSYRDGGRVVQAVVHPNARVEG
jgi:NADPH2:quinone reductase